MSKNDVAWEELFETHRILARIEDSGVFEISSANINKLREARLMTKFDHKINLPIIFRQHDLTIQPNSRGTYLIGHFQSYQEIPAPPDTDEDIESFQFPTEIETIDPTQLSSESAALLCAYNAGIINDLFEEPTTLTVLGRMSTGEFSYRINDSRQGTPYEIKVVNAQCEIDSGFEGRHIFAVVEAKNETVTDFLIRQLYYPYRLWTGKTRKEVMPVFMTFSNDVFSFYVFRFADEALYNSIELVKRKRYQIGAREIELEDIIRALEASAVTLEPEQIPFPQADSFSRIVDLLTQIYGAGVLSQEDITTNHAFDLRQTQYYTNAARYLGLVEHHSDRNLGVTYTLTRDGERIMGLKNPQQRNLALVEAILKHRVFNDTLRLYIFKQAGRPTVEQVVEIMRGAELGLDRQGTTTIRRRAQTVLAWMDWIMRLKRR
ncbi:MAG: hypothetical protein LC785_07315 [Acidobacteria bacterium]|nr:hypothetical protein [Acidobacteriota bacterium]MCA1641747.1 hypothetical protein [Acidobacteriota bacterium]